MWLLLKQHLLRPSAEKHLTAVKINMNTSVDDIQTPGKNAFALGNSDTYRGIGVISQQGWITVLVHYVYVSCRYTGHKMNGYKLDCCLSSKDTHVLSCSEDGHVYCWDLVEVSIFMSLSCLKVILWSFNVVLFWKGSLSLKLPVGKAVVQSLSFHPTETILLTAMERLVQVWVAEPDEEAMGT